jgi:hypothetical protein
LIVFGSGLGLPEQMVWPLVLLLSFGMASLMAAAQHGPWWLKVLGLLFTLMVMGTWSLRNPSLAGWAGWPVIAAGLMAALLALVIIRWRRRFAWWEFALMWAMVGLAMTIGVAETREAKLYGSDLNPLNLQQTAAVLGYLALPAATLAGASVAEVTVRATVAATQNAQRFAKQGWPYLILIVVLCVRLIQCVWLIAERDPVVEGLAALLWASALVAAFAVVGLITLRLSRRQQAAPVVSELGDELGRVRHAPCSGLLIGPTSARLARARRCGGTAVVRHHAAAHSRRRPQPGAGRCGLDHPGSARCSPRPEQPGSDPGVHRRHAGRVGAPAAVRRSDAGPDQS